MACANQRAPHHLLSPIMTDVSALLIHDQGTTSMTPEELREILDDMAQVAGIIEAESNW